MKMSKSNFHIKNNFLKDLVNSKKKIQKIICIKTCFIQSCLSCKSKGRKKITSPDSFQKNNFYLL